MKMTISDSDLSALKYHEWCGSLLPPNCLLRGSTPGFGCTAIEKVGEHNGRLVEFSHEAVKEFERLHKLLAFGAGEP